MFETCKKGVRILKFKCVKTLVFCSDSRSHMNLNPEEEEKEKQLTTV